MTDVTSRLNTKTSKVSLERQADNFQLSRTCRYVPYFQRSLALSLILTLGRVVVMFVLLFLVASTHPFDISYQARSHACRVVPANLDFLERVTATAASKRQKEPLFSTDHKKSFVP